MAEYIDKEAAISLIKQYGHDAIDGGRYSLDTVDDCIELANRIEALPMEDVAPVVHGRWVEYQIPPIVCCSNCDWATDVKEKNFQYCPNCGAKMNEKEAVYD